MHLKKLYNAIKTYDPSQSCKDLYRVSIQSELLYLKKLSNPADREHPVRSKRSRILITRRILQSKCNFISQTFIHFTRAFSTQSESHIYTIFRLYIQTVSSFTSLYLIQRSFHGKTTVGIDFYSIFCKFW